jgi:hypothetical protein
VTETSSLNFASEMADSARYAANQYHVNAQIVAPPNIDDEAAEPYYQRPVLYADYQQAICQRGGPDQAFGSGKVK